MLKLFLCEYVIVGVFRKTAHSNTIRFGNWCEEQIYADSSSVGTNDLGQDLNQ